MRVRLAAALGAVVVGVAICLHQRHFSVSVEDPMSFVRMLRHKCGVAMAAAVLWAGAEMVVSSGRWARGWIAAEGSGIPTVLRG